MTTIKSYTDLEQSRKLAEILPLESADMCFANDGTAIKIDANPYNVRKHMWKDVQLIPCWSLASLLGVVSEEVSLNSFKDGNWNAMVQQNDKLIYSNAGNPIDACYKLILKLNERKML